MNFIAIIPARYESSRFPGKPLVDIGGKTMIQRVVGQTKKAIEHVFVATDDKRIYDHVVNFGGTAIMTSKNHTSGTDRCAEAAAKASKLLNQPIDVVLNIQGDEPFIQPEQINALATLFQNNEINLGTLVKPFTDNNDIFDPNQPKVILKNNNQAIYFSRSPIPFLRGVPQEKWVFNHTFYKHIGLYGYRMHTLQELTKLPVGKLEKAESLEQNRWIEAGYDIFVEFTNQENIAIDTPDDLLKLREAGLS